MNRVLVFNRNELERKSAGDILSSGLRGAEVVLAGTPEQTIALIRKGNVDFFIADIPNFDLDSCNMITLIKKLAPDMPILITSIGDKKEIASYVWRLGVQDYLLKPCRPSWLLAAANALMRQSAKAAEGRADQRQAQYLQRISEHVRAFEYKKCLEAAKEYLDLLYRSGDNNLGGIRENVVTFMEGVAKMGGALGADVQWKLSGCMERFRARFDLQGRKYDTYVVFESMLNMIFELLESNSLLAVSDKQKILNYIDRNIKKGIGLDEASEYMNMSSCYFSKFFKKLTGENFITYVTSRKIEAAKQMLLDTDMPVINIAYELSYGETNYFSKAFKKKVGVTPTEFREGKTAPAAEAEAPSGQAGGPRGQERVEVYAGIQLQYQNLLWQGCAGAP